MNGSNNQGKAVIFVQTANQRKHRHKKRVRFDFLVFFRSKKKRKKKNRVGKS